MISEQDFLQALSYVEGRIAPLSLTLLELMFGPGVRDGDVKDLKVRKALAKKITGDVILWPASEERPFNVIHVGPIKMADVLRISSKKSHPKSEGPKIIESMVVDIMFGFRERPLQDHEVDSGRQDVVVVMPVLDGDERTTYFWTRLRGHVTSFLLKDPTEDTTATREYLRDFYAERVSLLRGDDWQTAFFLSDLRTNLMWELPADWRMTPDGVTATMSPDISLHFDKNFDVRLDFRGQIFWFSFSSITQYYVRSVEPCIKMLLGSILSGPRWSPFGLFPSSKIPMSAQQIFEITSPLPPWMRKIFESNIQECHTHDDAMIKHLEQGLKSIQDRMDLTKQALDLLQVHDVTLQMIESGDEGPTV